MAFTIKTARNYYSDLIKVLVQLFARAAIHLILLLPSFSLYAQEYQYNFHHFSSSDGLPSSQIYQIIQDRNGFIWFGTDRGVVRYNGYEFNVFTTGEGLSSNVIFYLDESPDGTIWANGKNGTLDYFRHEKFNPFALNTELNDQFDRHKIPLSLSVESNQIMLFYFMYLEFSTDSVSNLMILKQSKPHIHNSMSSEGVTLYHLPNSIHISWVRRDQPPSSSWRHESMIPVPVHVFNEDNLHFIDTINVNVFGYRIPRSCSYENDIYFSLSRSVFLVRDTTIQFLGEFDADIIELEISRKGDLIVGTRQGLWIVRNRKFDDKVRMLENEEISSFLEDEEGGFWIGTLYQGLYYLPPHATLYKEFDDRAAVTRIEGNDEAVFYITKNNTVYKEEMNQTVEKRNFASFPASFNFQMINKDELLLQTAEASLIILRTENLTVIKNESLIPNYFRKLEFIKDGFIGSYYNSINILNSNFEFIDLLIDADRSVIFSAVDTLGNGRYLGATNQGVKIIHHNSLYDYRPDLEFFRTSISDQIIIADTLRAFASETAGILIQTKSDFFKIDKTNGLVSNNISQLIFAEGKIIALSKSGASVINADGMITNYTSSNGLVSNDINDGFYRNDSLWLATGAGVNIVDLKQQVNYTNTINLSSFQIDGVKQPIQSHYETSYSQLELDFTIIALSYSQYGQIEYRYKMEGHDRLWNYSSDTKIHYSNLQSGDYNFVISFRKPNGIWTTPKTIFSLKKNIPIALHPFLIALYILFIITISFLVLFFRYKKIKKRARDKYNLLDLERRALQSQMNPHFIFNSLTSIQSLILSNKIDESVDYLVKFAHLTRGALNYSSKKFVSLIKDLELNIQYVELERLRFINSFELEITVELNDLDVLIPPAIIQPFIENSILHGLIPKEKKDGLLEIYLLPYSELSISCIIVDNGVGRQGAVSDQNKNESKGIKMIEERLNLLMETDENNVRIFDRVNENKNQTGTVAWIIIPILKSYESINN